MSIEALLGIQEAERNARGAKRCVVAVCAAAS